MANGAINAYALEASLAFITLIAIVLLYRWHTSKENNFDLTDALLGDDGKVSLFKIGQATALIVSTWGFIILIQQGKLTEIYFTTYMSIWAGINLARNIFGKEVPKV
jgi:hypothetical protein